MLVDSGMALAAAGRVLEGRTCEAVVARNGIDQDVEVAESASEVVDQDCLGPSAASVRSSVSAKRCHAR